MCHIQRGFLHTHIHTHRHARTHLLFLKSEIGIAPCLLRNLIRSSMVEPVLRSGWCVECDVEINTNG
jgi:hypothetical protein